jgi:hypothetical protein
VSIFKCFDDPKDGRFLKVHGITDGHLVKYIVERANGTSKEEALDRLVEGRTATKVDTDEIRRIVEQFPIPA